MTLSFRRRLLAGLFIGGLSFCSLADASTLRPSGDIHSGNIYLSDLFSGISHSEDRLLGPAPEPGQSVSLGGAQLIAIADEYGVDWDGQSSTSRIVLKRAGKTYGKDDFSMLIKDYLKQRGENVISVSVDKVSENITVSEDGHDPLTVAEYESNTLTPLNSDFELTAPTRFTAVISYRDKLIHVSGTIRESFKVLKFRSSLPAGYVIQEEDLDYDSGYTGSVTRLMKDLPDRENLVGMALTHAVKAGTPAQKGDFREAILVHRNDPVLIVYNAPGLHLTATGRAVEDGSVGHYVHAVNLGNKMILTGKVSPTGRIVVDETSTAIPQDSAEAKRLGIQSLDLK